MRIFPILILVCSLSLHAMDEDGTKKRQYEVMDPTEETELTPDEWERLFGKDAPEPRSVHGIRLDFNRVLGALRKEPAEVAVLIDRAAAAESSAGRRTSKEEVRREETDK